jgi:hypothetical protein
VTKDAQLFQMPIPRSPSNQLIALDLFGAQRTISIDGVWTSSDGTISTFISWLDGLVSGTQTTKSYASDTSGTSYTVFVQTTEWKREGGEVNLINYSITMLEAASVT